MRDHGINVRGHCLLWPGWRHLPRSCAVWLTTRRHLSIGSKITSTTSADLRGKVIEWDVVNEPYLNNDLMHILGYGAMAKSFKLRPANRPFRAALSERSRCSQLASPGSPLQRLYSRVQALQKEAAPIGGIGMQGHFDDNLVAPVDLLAIYDRFATLGIPIRITELDINVADEQLQADYFRDFLTASFSDPEINGIVLWGFWAAQDWRPGTALYRKDWSIKPNGQIWKDLVLGKWWTNANGISAADGTYSTARFSGRLSGDGHRRPAMPDRRNHFAAWRPHRERIAKVKVGRSDWAN